MGMNVILGLLFLGTTALMWSMLTASLAGYNRYEAEFTEHTGTKLETLFLFFDARKVFFINVLGILVIPVAVYLLTGSLFYVLLAVVVVLAMPKLVFYLLEKKRREAIRNGLPDTLAQIAGGMRAGSTFISATQIMVEETKGPISQEFSLFLREQKLGLTLDESMDNLAERVDLEEMDLLVTAVQISRELGGNLAEIFERLSDTMRRKLEMEGKIRALTSQGKLQGWVVGLLPFFIMFALMYMEHDAMQAIFTSLLGWIFLAIIIVLTFFGAMMIRKIVSIDV
jgi:tight adherence protein B